MSPNPSSAKVVKFEQIAARTRCDVIRMIHLAKSGNPGSVLSATDILVTLYHAVMKIDPKNPDWEDRDLLCLSKGHACPAQYSLLARLGFFPVEEIYGYRQFNSRCQTHPEYGKLPGMDFTSGSLGQGLSAGVGMALALRKKKKGNRVFVLLGDGEIQEGQVWEAAMFAGHYHLDAITAIVDVNGLQGDARTSQTMGLEPLADKWKSFGWEVEEVDGHDFTQLLPALSRTEHAEKPKMVLARTIKGKGVSFMEDSVEWHAVNNMADADRDAALKELERTVEEAV